LSCASILFALVLVESAARYRDGDSLVSLRLRTRTPALASLQWKSGAAGTPALPAYVRTIPIRGIDIAWFQVDPPEVTRRPVDPVLQTRYEEFDRRGVYPPPSFYIWNTELMKEACGSKENLFRSVPRDVKVFANSDRSPFPAFRFPPNQTLPSGLVTNQFGFRGPALAPRKSAGLIRIAFVGASTTQNVHAYRWSYPELTGSWLNMWLRHQHRPERVEIINAGREGLSARDIREIVKREVVPLEPDYVVYLEGANMVPVPLVKWPGGRAPAVAPSEATGMYAASQAPGGPGDGEPRLVVERAPGHTAGMEYDIGEGAVMGRGDQAEIRLEDPFASSRHARLVPQGGIVVLEDLGSTNGTYLNEELLSGPQPLHRGDRVRIGDSEFTYADR
jgi:hypothetical protein